MLREFEDRDPRDRKPAMEYVIGAVATLAMLALLISGISAVLA